MKLSTTNDIAGHSVAETIGIARGSTVRTRNVGNDILAAFKNLVGGEVAEYTRLQADAREQALQRMIEDANNLGADAVICIRFQTSVMMAGASAVQIGTANFANPKISETVIHDLAKWCKDKGISNLDEIIGVAH